jgi:hypothetical protein
MNPDERYVSVISDWAQLLVPAYLVRSLAFPHTQHRAMKQGNRSQFENSNALKYFKTSEYLVNDWHPGREHLTALIVSSRNRHRLNLHHPWKVINA